MMDTMLLDAAEKLFAASLSPAVITALESGADALPLWATLTQAGLADVLISETQGGVGLTMAALFPLARAAGEHGVPLPLIETALLRPLTGTLPDGPMAIASTVAHTAAGWHAPRVPFGAVAGVLAVELDGKAQLVPLKHATRQAHGLDADITLTPETLAVALPLPEGTALAELGALAQAARIAGALSKVLAMSIEHATTRAQFGRKIADFQAVQHQLAELAEAVQLASLAAEMGFVAGRPEKGALMPALAKARTSALAARGAAIAHAVHGAMGIAQEFPLQIFTRALHSARLAHGAEGFWQDRLGAALLSSGQTSADFVDTALTP